MHRLGAAGTEIDDCESALTQYHAAFSLDPDVTGIRPAMPQRLDHGFADRAQRVGRGRRAPVDHAGDAAHSTTPENELRCFLLPAPVGRVARPRTFVATDRPQLLPSFASTIPRAATLF